MAKETFQIDFLISDESINRYGYRILTEGIDTSKFEQNPTAYFNHDASQPAVGKWVKIWKENNELKGTLQFDEKDDMAMKLYHKYKNDYMRAVSLNILPIEESDDAKDLLPGQKLSTVTKSELMEVSLVTIPGNKNAVKLSTPEGVEYKLNLITNTKNMAKEEKTVEQLSQELDTQKKLNAENLVLRHKERGVVQDGEVDSLKALALDNYDTVSKMLDARVKPEVQTPPDDTAGEKAKVLVALHFDRGAITADEKATFEAAAKLDYDGTKKVLEAKKGKTEVQNFVSGMANSGEQNQQTNERLNWGYYEYFKNDPGALELMQHDDPEKYKKLMADFEKANQGIIQGNYQ